MFQLYSTITQLSSTIRNLGSSLFIPMPLPTPFTPFSWASSLLGKGLLAGDDPSLRCSLVLLSRACPQTAQAAGRSVLHPPALVLLVEEGGTGGEVSGALNRVAKCSSFAGWAGSCALGKSHILCNVYSYVCRLHSSCYQMHVRWQVSVLTR